MVRSESKEGKMTQPISESGLQVLPFYLVADESGSMGGPPIDSLNQALPELHAAVTTDPYLASIARFGIIGFSDDAELVFPLTDLANVTSFPVMHPKGTTSFGSAFRLLRTTIDADIADLRAQGITPHRPLVFFFSDGEPTDHNWESDLKALHDKTWKNYPNVVSFGLGQANPDIMQKVATVQAFIQNQNQYLDPAAAIKTMIAAVTQSVISSAGSIMAGQGPQVLIPQSVPGMISLSADPL